MSARWWRDPPTVGVVGWKNSGKTALVVRLVEHLSAQGLRVATVKHTHHDVEVDRPGADSFRHRAAGSCEAVLCSPNRLMRVREHDADSPEPPLADIVAGMRRPCDLVLVEGYKSEPLPKIEVWRPEVGRDPIGLTDDTIFALAATGTAPPGTPPAIDLDDTAGIAALILATTREPAEDDDA